jgi:D-alanyl-D-alanine dipeptidase
MPSVYDEMSPRAYPAYTGGGAAQREHRDLLRAAMEAEGFTVEPNEWWHFNFRDWARYPILDIKFSEVQSRNR